MDIDKLEGWQVVTLDYQACGVLLAECGDRQRYGAFCKAAIDRFQGSTNGDMAGRILKTCLLFPSSRALLDQLAPMARMAAEGYRSAPQERFQPWPVLYLTLWEYRRGDFAAVDDWSQRAAEHSIEPEPWAASVQIIQAMADQKRGRYDKAAGELARTRQTINSYFEASRLPVMRQGYWYDWLFARILLREAGGMVEAKPASSPESTTLQ
jgi:eukaryotic-like serine/threonine-protein kinase